MAVVVDLIKCKDCRKARNKLFKDLFEQLVGMHQNRKANSFPRTQCGSIFKYTLTGRTNAYSILMNRNGSIKLGKKKKKKDISGRLDTTQMEPLDPKPPCHNMYILIKCFGACKHTS